MNFRSIILGMGLWLSQATFSSGLNNVESQFQTNIQSILEQSPTPLYKDANIEVYPFFETINDYNKAPPYEIAKAVQSFHWKNSKNYVIYIVKIRGKKPRVLIKSDISTQWDPSHQTSTEFRYFFFGKKMIMDSWKRIFWRFIPSFKELKNSPNGEFFI